MKNIGLLLVQLFMTTHLLFAQDVIVKKDGSTILSKVVEVGSSEVKYKKWSNQSGPLYTVSISELLSINYKNGDKETFDVVQTTDVQSLQMRTVQPDARNAELIQLYNRDYHLTEKTLKDCNAKKEAKGGVLFFKVGESSIMSNEELEMSFVTCTTVHPDPISEGRYMHMRYNILLKNKTDKIIYVDLGTCTRTSNHGEHRVYYTSEDISVGQSSGGGVSLGMGAVTNALGVGGVIGTLANGVSVNRGSEGMVNKSYSQMRVLSIPPYGTSYLTDYKYMESRKETEFRLATYVLAEKAEEFNFYTYGNNKLDTYESSKSCKFFLIQFDRTFKIKRGVVNQGEEKNYIVENSPLVYNYVITYSTVNDFSTYSTLNSTLYVSKIIGTDSKVKSPSSLYWKRWGTDEGMSGYIENYNHNTICGPILFTK